MRAETVDGNQSTCKNQLYFNTINEHITTQIKNDKINRDGEQISGYQRLEIVGVKK